MNIKRLMDIGLLPWFPPSSWSADAWSAYAYQRPYSQGSAQRCCVLLKK